MRVLLVTPYFVPAYAFGGPVRMAEVMVEGLLAAGHEVVVATTDALDHESRVPPGTPDAPAGVEVHRFANVHHGLAANAMGWSPRGFRAWIRRETAGFDLVLLHDVYSVLSVVASRAAAVARVPYVMQPFGSLAPSPERGRPRLKRAFLRLWGRRTIRDAAVLVHSTAHEGREFLTYGARPDQLLEMPLPLELPPRSGAEGRDEPIIVNVGRLDPIKGLDALLEAVAVVRDRVPDVHLDLAGPGGAYVAELERLAVRLQLDDRVRFHGFVEAEEKVRLLERARVFCLLSHSEGLPVAALEAMACGTPVVLSRGCHLDEIDGRAGIVVDGEPLSAARALADLLVDPDRCRELGGAAAEFAEAYRRERVMPRIVQAFEAIAGSA